MIVRIIKECREISKGKYEVIIWRSIGDRLVYFNKFVSNKFHIDEIRIVYS